MGIAMEVLINFIEVQFTYSKCTHFKFTVPGVLINADTHVHPNHYKNCFHHYKKFLCALHSKLFPQATVDLITISIDKFSLF